jgi:hypothetical protein
MEQAGQALAVGMVRAALDSAAVAEQAEEPDLAEALVLPALEPADPTRAKEAVVLVTGRVTVPAAAVAAAFMVPSATAAAEAEADSLAAASWTFNALSNRNLKRP